MVRLSPRHPELYRPVWFAIAELAKTSGIPGLNADDSTTSFTRDDQQRPALMVEDPSRLIEELQKASSVESRLGLGHSPRV